VGIDRKTFFLSLALAAGFSLLLLVVFAHLGPQHHVAEATPHAPDPAPPREVPARAPVTKAARIPRRSTAPHRERRTRRFEAIIDNLVTPSGQVNQRAVRALRVSGPAVVPALLDRFTGEATRFQEAILLVLSGFDDPEIGERLLAALEAEPPERFALAIGSALRARGDPRLCERLEELTQAPRAPARAAAALALRSCPGGSAAAALVRLLKTDDSATVRVSALSALGDSHEAFLDQALGIALADRAQQIRLEAVRIVERHRLTRFAAELEPLLDDPAPAVGRAARRALAAFETPNQDG
jgi:HEAT repeat protein